MVIANSESPIALYHGPKNMVRVNSDVPVHGVINHIFSKERSAPDSVRALYAFDAHASSAVSASTSLTVPCTMVTFC